MARIEKVGKEIEKGALLNPRISREIRMGHLQESIPEKDKYHFTGKRAEVLRKLMAGAYRNDNAGLRRDLQEIDFDLSWASLAGANLSGLDLSKANLAGAELSGADLSRANLSQAKMGPAKLLNANLQSANMHFATLIMAEATGADFSSADLSLANLEGARLKNAKFVNANMASADLSDTNLTDADFTGANVSGISVQNAIVRGTIFEAESQKNDYPEKEKKYGEYYKPPGKAGPDETQESVYGKKDEYKKKGPYPK